MPTSVCVLWACSAAVDTGPGVAVKEALMPGILFTIKLQIQPVRASSSDVVEPCACVCVCACVY